MKTSLQNTSARVWFLSGLTGMVLMAGLLLEEGQARTYSPSPMNSSIPVPNMDRPTHPSQLIPIKKPAMRKTTAGKQANSASQQDIVETKPAKKRMGLAMLFLGILAEDG